MKNKVIIGAGPAGLYAAIKSVKEGLRNVVIYDPRAPDPIDPAVRKYNRPGHLNHSVFRKAESGLGIKFWSGEKTGHIKDLERALFAEAVRLGIRIENKHFLRLHQDAVAPGVVVANSDGTEEIVEADYVFDCTGSRREVVAAVNRIIPDSPLKMVTITEPPVRNHFLAYVKMSASDWEQFQMLQQYPEDFMDALSYARSIVKLRNLGWSEFKRPRCYGANFGKDKVCLYFHAPDGLAKENYDLWVQAVLEFYAPISYQHLPPSTKPRFMAFNVKAEALQQVSYKGDSLPTMIALGDAQIDFDYALAHGILDGMGRIDALFEHMEIINGEIYYFYPDEYLATIHGLLQEHKSEVTTAADRLRHSFASALEAAQSKFRHALMHSDNHEEKIIFTDILKEIEARQSYAKAKHRFAECDGILKRPIAEIDRTIAKFNLIHTDLLIAFNGLPASFAEQRDDTRNLLAHLALSWKEIGNALFKNGRNIEAIDAYKRAIDIYNLPVFIGLHPVQERPIYSNLAIVYLKEKRYPETIAAANTALEMVARSSGDEALPLKEKIVFNLLKAMCLQAQECLSLGNRDEAHSLHVKARHLIATQESTLSRENHLQISTILAKLQQQLALTLSRAGSVGSESNAGSGATELPAADPDSPSNEHLMRDDVLFSENPDAARRKDAVGLQNFGTFAPPRESPVTPATKTTDYECCVIC